MAGSFGRLLLLTALLLAPLALAQDGAPVLVERIDDGALLADAGEPAVARFRLLNLNPDEDYYVTVAVAAPGGWSARSDTAPFFLAPRAQANVTVEVAPEETPRGGARVEVTFSFTHVRTGAVTSVVERFEVGSSAPPRVVGVLANPLPAPLDNAYGTFLLDMLFWVAIGVFAAFAGNWVVRMMTARASNATTRQIVEKIQRPVFLFVFFLGLAQSFAILPRNLLVVAIEKVLVVVAVTVFGLYVVYRLLDGVLTYYQREVASRTSTKVDDVLIPVLRKVGLVIVYVVGVILTLQRLGWDPTFVFAGAGIAGLVIAFAAQDTFSNLFSGIFLMIDRPFAEGDDIRLETGEVARVEQIGLRTTRLYIGRSHETVTLPNNQLASTRVVNLTGPDRRYWLMVEVGVSYDSDPEHVRRTLDAVARAHPRVLSGGDWEPLVFFNNFGDSALLFTLRCAVDDYRFRFLTASELRFAISEAFRREGIEIPFPQRVVHMRGAQPAETDASS